MGDPGAPQRGHLAPDPRLWVGLEPVAQRRYGTHAEAFVQLEAGQAAQNILLQAGARGLAAVPVGRLDPSRPTITLALPPGLTVLYFIPVALAP